MKTFKQAKKDFCTEAGKWVRRQPNLTTAWRRCRCGSWMAWWLHMYRGVDPTVLRNISDKHCASYLFGAPGEFGQHAYANELRATFMPSGRRRSGK